MQSNIMVSICCLTYNHEKYIRDALEGFLMQNTDFSYEVLVHDDASTDGTANIIKEFAEKYPNIIKPIFQKENQLSKKIRIINTYIAPLVKGKYIAYCEGDDYWCSSNKLQKQVDFLEAHPEYSACVHNTRRINCVTGKAELQSIYYKDCTVKTEQVIQYGWNTFHLSSIVHKREFLIRPEIFYSKCAGDYPMSVYLAMVGEIYYLNEVMSVYRYLSNKDSWTYKHTILTGANADMLISHAVDQSRLLKKIDQYSEKKYHEIIDQVIRRNEFKVLDVQGKYVQAYKEYKDVIMQLPKTDLLRFMIKLYAPFTVNLYRFIQEKRYKKMIDKRGERKEFS